MVATNQKPLTVAGGTIERAQATVERDALTTINVPAKVLNPGMTGVPNSTTLEKPVRKQAFDAEASLFQLPSDFLKTPTTPYQPQSYTLTLPSKLVEQLQLQADPDGVAVRSLLLAAFHALLYRYTQQATIDLALTLPLGPGRGTYTTAMRTLLQGGCTVHTLIRQMATTLSDVPGCLDALPPPAQSDHPTASGASLPIAVTFVEDGFRVTGPAQLLSALPLPSSVAAAAPDVHLFLWLHQGRLALVLQYNASLFHAATIQRLGGHFQVLLAGMMQNQARTLAQLPLLTPAETHQLLVDWHSGSVAYPDTPIHQVIAAQAVQQPNAIAVTCQAQMLTYAALNQRANQLAHYLTHVGVTAEDRVAVCLVPSLEVVVSLLAIFKAGGVYLPLDPTHPTARLATILAETQPKVLLTQAHLLPQLPAIAAHTLCLDQAQALLDPLPTHNPAIEVPLHQTSHLIYTSGTTGQPKGVLTSHGNLVQYIRSAQARFRFDRHDVMPAFARFTFSITMLELLSPLVAGGRLVILERDQILDFPRLVPTLQQVTVLHTSPSLLHKLLAYIQANNIDRRSFDGLKHVSTGGDMVPVALLETMQQVFPQAEIHVIYGCSEVSCLGCSDSVSRDRPLQSRVGKPFPNVTVRLYDAHQNLVPLGLPGEIYLGGAGVTQGYWQREALTQEKFITLDGDRFYRTGDIGRLDADGNLEMLGRADFQIKLRGMRLELGEIEATLRQAPGVCEGVVMARALGAGASSEPREQSLVAYVVLDQAQPPPIATIRSLLQAKLPAYMVPSAFVVLEALPVNMNQKVDRQALPLPTLENMAGSQPFVAPRDEWEQQLTTIWETVLDMKPIGIHDNFFEIGGHSLLIVSLMTQIEAVFGQTLPLSTLLTEPTIAQLAALLSQPEQFDRSNSLVLLREGGTQPPVFFIHDGEGETLLYRNLAYCLKPEHPVYGIQPYSQAGHPILHTRIVEMAAYYIEQIRTIQPEGPYLLGGLCVGGFLAFEMARQLQNQGQTVAMVALIDTADVEATVRSGFIANQRLNSFSQSLNQGQTLNPQQLLSILGKVSRKVYNLITYEVGTKLEKIHNQVKIRLFRYCLDQGLPIPPFLQNLSVQIVLKFAEREYVPQASYQGEVFLSLATQSDSSFDGTLIDDTPYTEIYSDPLLGWGGRATGGIAVYHCPGGHSSMLQVPNAQMLAATMQAYIDAAIANRANAQVLPEIVVQPPEKALVS